jgi:hypothetical protein
VALSICFYSCKTNTDPIQSQKGYISVLVIDDIFGPVEDVDIYIVTDSLYIGSKRHSFYRGEFDRMEILLLKQGRSGNSVFSRRNNSLTVYRVKQHFGGIR